MDRDSDNDSDSDLQTGKPWHTIVQPLSLFIDCASLGQSEFDLPDTSTSASWHRPDPPLALNLETLGQSEVTMPGDDAGMEVTEATAVPWQRHDDRAGLGQYPQIANQNGHIGKLHTQYHPGT